MNRSHPTQRDIDRAMLDLAASVALRGAGRVEPNPMVGCVIGTPDGRILGIGHHRRYGGPHAEVEALASCARAGHSPLGATAWVTLEPCNHFGKTPPCSQALIRAGVARVVAARCDPHDISTGGTEALRAAGIDATISDLSLTATRISDPFLVRTLLRRPWVIAKWAQTIDARVATRDGESQWLSGPRARRRVHAWRGRVDAVLTGIGTVLSDDPRLTCRDAQRRRIARRVVVDPNFRFPESCGLLETLPQAPLSIAVGEAAMATNAPRLTAMRALGVEIIPLTMRRGEHFAMLPMLEHLSAGHQAMNVLVEAGPGLMGSLIAEDLVDELRIHTAPMLFGDPEALPPVRVGPLPRIPDARRFDLVTTRRIGPDVETIYQRPLASLTSSSQPARG